MGMDRVRKIREFMGLNRYYFAKHLSVSDRHIKTMEETSQSLRDDTQLKLIDTFLEKGGTLEQYYEMLREDVKNMSPRSRGRKKGK